MTDRTVVGGQGGPTMAAAAGRREALLRIALDPETDPDVLTMLAHEDAADDGVLLALICHPRLPDEAWEHIARAGSPTLLKALLAQEKRLRERPPIARAVLENPAAGEAMRGLIRSLLEEGGSGAGAPGALESAEGPRTDGDLAQDRPRVPAGILDRSQLLQLALDPAADQTVLTVVSREAGADEEVLLALVRHPRTPDGVLVYVALVGTPQILQEMLGRADRLRAHPLILQAMLENGEAEEPLRVKVRALLNEIPAEAAKRPVALYQLIKGMSTGQRLAFAMKGSKEARMILIKDPNEMVALEVIYSPRITETEILAIAQMRDVSEHVLRAIAGNKQYRGKKQIIWALLNNPKTPPGVTTGFNLGNLSEKELQGLMKNRNIPSALQRAVRAALERKQRRAGGHGH
jgi:hypothetical protein